MRTRTAVAGTDSKREWPLPLEEDVKGRHDLLSMGAQGEAGV